MDSETFISKAHAGQRVSEFLSDPEIEAVYADSIRNLDVRILGFDPADQMHTTIAKAMRLGIRELWSKFEGIIAEGRRAEAIMSGEEPETMPGRVL